MPTIEISSWRENFVGGTGWDAHPRSELEKRLRRGIRTSPKAIRRLAQQIHERQPVCLCGVHEEAVFELTQILQAMGADIHVLLDNSNSEQLFKRVPRRRGGKDSSPRQIARDAEGAIQL